MPVFSSLSFGGDESRILTVRTMSCSLRTFNVACRVSPGRLYVLLLLRLVNLAHEVFHGQVDFACDCVALGRSWTSPLAFAPFPSAFVSMLLMLVNARLVACVALLGPGCLLQDHLWELTCMLFAGILVRGSRRLRVGPGPVVSVRFCTWAQCLQEARTAWRDGRSTVVRFPSAAVGAKVTSLWTPLPRILVS